MNTASISNNQAIIEEDEDVEALFIHDDDEIEDAQVVEDNYVNGTAVANSVTIEELNEENEEESEEVIQEQIPPAKPVNVVEEFGEFSNSQKSMLSFAQILEVKDDNQNVILGKLMHIVSFYGQGKNYDDEKVAKNLKKIFEKNGIDVVNFNDKEMYIIKSIGSDINKDLEYLSNIGSTLKKADVDICVQLSIDERYTQTSAISASCSVVNTKDSESETNQTKEYFLSYAIKNVDGYGIVFQGKLKNYNEEDDESFKVSGDLENRWTGYQKIILELCSEGNTMNTIHKELGKLKWFTAYSVSINHSRTTQAINATFRWDDSCRRAFGMI